jgi:hypothetical protein
VIRLLLTADAGADVLREVTAGRSYPFLKVPHSGSKTSLDEHLVRRLAPCTAYIPVGESGYGNPALEILELLRRSGVQTFCSSKTKDCRRDCRLGGYEFDETAPETTTTTTTSLPGGGGCAGIDGIAVVDCACAAGHPAACNGATLPGSVTSGFPQACAAADHGNANASKKGKRLLGKASKKLAKLRKTIGKPKVAKKLPADCVVAAQAFFADVQSRVDAVRAAR